MLCRSEMSKIAPARPPPQLSRPRISEEASSSAPPARYSVCSAVFVTCSGTTLAQPETLKVQRPAWPLSESEGL